MPIWCLRIVKGLWVIIGIFSFLIHLLGQGTCRCSEHEQNLRSDALPAVPGEALIHTAVISAGPVLPMGQLEPRV